MNVEIIFFNRFFIFFSLFLLVYFVYSLFLIKIVLFRFKKLSFIIKILNLVGQSNIWVRCCLNQGYSRILVKSLSKRGSPSCLLFANLTTCNYFADPHAISVVNSHCQTIYLHMFVTLI